MSAHSTGKLESGTGKLALRALTSGAASLIPDKPTTLAVIQGFHSGASLELTKPSYTIGSDGDSDIVLRDPGIESLHARLHRKGSQVEIEAVGGDLKLASGETIRKGQGCRRRLPLGISLGDAQLQLTGPEPIKSRWSLSQRPLLAGGVLIAAVFAISVAANGLSVAKTDDKSAKLGLADGQVTGSIPGGADAEHLAAAQAELTARLAQSGLETVAVGRSSERLVVSGTIPNAQSGTWTDVRSWFDQKFGQVPLVSNIAVGDAAQPPRLTLQAIWYGERPYVIAGDGARYHEGAFTNDGWTIKEIGQTALVLTKGGATVALKYQ
ncbi:FHA domain-containing protein [Mesorhizobium sp. NPDC059054]|uniref:SctD/MshK family protein n=1 Tax=unclassified Mesorhizobium TaxID=325217 RepID=UPI0006C75463|nr:EscD/YscD/HrpQ family type III secretion system periplasmic domain-containing protein [Mesorhizobium sp. 1M-11]